MAQQVGPAEDCNWSYSGSNTNVPTIQVLRPTWDEFKDFNKYLKKIERNGVHKGGLAKVIPPKEWNPRKSGYNLEDIMHIKIPDPISQVINGNRGIFQSINVRKKATNLRDFHKMANSPQYRTPGFVDYEDLERKYWKNLTFVAPVYGADVPGSITDPDCEHWNIQNLGSILDWVNEDYNIKIDGVNTAYLYFGMWKTTFAWHTEDMDLHSINYLHYGESKFWYTIPPEYARRFERMAEGLFPNLVKDCPAYLRHKMCLISPTILRQNSIPYNKIVQKEGEFMITFPLGYHSGFNTGFNIAESTNFATERWVEYGKRCVRCYCKNDMVQISMDCFVKRLQPERYDKWLRGEDYGPHPEETSGKSTAAPQPTAEEFIFNPKNKDKPIPLCLLEPNTSKKRRHPIHKKKSIDHEAESDGTDVDEILDLGDYHRKLGQDKKLDRKRAKAEQEVDWDTKVEDCLKPSQVVIPRLMLKPSENVLSFNLAPSPTKSDLTASPASLKSSPEKLKPDPNLRERWLSSFARTTVTMTPFQTFPATSTTSFASTSAKSNSTTSCLSETISKLKSSLLWGQGSMSSITNSSATVPPRTQSNGTHLDVKPPITLREGTSPFSTAATTSSVIPPSQTKESFSTSCIATSDLSTTKSWSVCVDPRFSGLPKEISSARSLSNCSDTASTCSTPRRDFDERLSRNRELLSNCQEKSIKASVAVLENLYSRWCPPMVLPRENLISTSQWDVRAACKMDKGMLYVKISGPSNINRPFAIPFSNIFASSRSQQFPTSWPPTEDMMGQCEDLTRWEVDMCIDPYTDIKATVIDPWRKAYLLTIPVKLIKQKN